MLIREEQPADYGAIRYVNRMAFGTDAEGKLVDALRAGGFLRISSVAEQAGEIVGHLAMSDLIIETETEPMFALALAPMAVLPHCQRQGIGSALIRRTLDACRERGHAAVIVLGHPEYYPRFGFSTSLAAELDSPYAGESFMALELQPGVLAGVNGRVVYPPPFDAV